MKICSVLHIVPIIVQPFFAQLSNTSSVMLVASAREWKSSRQPRQSREDAGHRSQYPWPTPLAPFPALRRGSISIAAGAGTLRRALLRLITGHLLRAFAL